MGRKAELKAFSTVRTAAAKKRAFFDPTLRVYIRAGMCGRATCARFAGR